VGRTRWLLHGVIRADPHANSGSSSHEGLRTILPKAATISVMYGSSQDAARGAPGVAELPGAGCQERAAVKTTEGDALGVGFEKR